MSTRALALCRFCAVGLALSVAGRAQLATKSPFMPAQGAASNAPTANAPLEYRGFMETGEGVQYRIVDPAAKMGAWVKLNERNAELDLVAKQYDGSQQTLTIEHKGRTLTLEERKGKVVSSGAALQPVPPPPAAPSNVPPAVTQAVVLNPTPADEQRRLEAVASEVARRRALREQATQQITQGVAPQVAVPQPPVQPQQFPPQQNANPGNARGSVPTNRQR
jgi:hypothetical protein